MISKWFELKDDAINLRKSGWSIRRIEKKLNIPRSTLSGWFKIIEIPLHHKQKLTENWRNALIHARKKAVIWHQTEKRKRIEKAQQEASEVLNNINVRDRHMLELSLAMLYLGEGAKANAETAIGNSNPMILKFFLAILQIVYKLNPAKIRCQLNLRADQDPEAMIQFWMKELKLSRENFKHVSLDKRTKGSPTYDHYKGVCQVRYGNVAIQRKLIHLAELFCEKIIAGNMGS